MSSIECDLRNESLERPESGENVYDGSEFEKGYSKFVSFEELKGSNGYLDNDTLTLRCRMWKTGFDIPTSVKWEAHSRIKVSKLHYTWILKNISVANGVFENEFNKSVDITEYFTEDTDINLQLFKKGNLGECSLQFGIEMTKLKKNYFWIAVVHLMDAGGSVALSAQGEYLFYRSNEKLLWNFPLISKDKICINKKLCLPNNQLTLRCELSFADNNKLETFEFRETNEQESTTMDKQSDLQEVWIKNMQLCYKEGKFGDFIIRTPNRQFLVSRNILSAHSEVFDAMFERDMKERKTGIVDIEDLEDDTVSNVLKYVYTSTPDYTDYGIEALQKSVRCT
ncbi:hypothetical protein JTE90_007854 [Oedothorax gibbosus]|uniref:BTB domain-containing protein n=1 Tax=Oedothorax gibbosus TaxID=931172 RepID=A0AAV6VJ77_9ARAC|nr:hypothetical protein JTE90_007854 [Oedothorax gibbosus]